jgi:endonuclease/exonuclease/phosphatase family metal-dependent hydrolase
MEIDFNSIKSLHNQTEITDIRTTTFNSPAAESNHSRYLAKRQQFEVQYQQNISVLLTDKVPFFVGELGDQWQFPSDHLPVGMSINGIHFANWNILNTDYLNHIEANDQGLKYSLIMEANCPGKDPRLTRREEILLKQVMSLLQHPTQPRSVLSLQETGAAFWEVLKEQLPTNYKTVTAFPDDLAHGDVYIYDGDLLEFEELQSQRYEGSVNTMMALTLKERSSGNEYRFIQSHVPGGPIRSEPARKELADFVMRNYDPNKSVVIMGDMNRPPRDFLENFARKAEEYSMEQPYTNAWIPYPTHINTHCEASWIDNIFFAVPEGTRVEIAKEDTFFPALQQTIDLLNKFN